MKIAIHPCAREVLKLMCGVFDNFLSSFASDGELSVLDKEQSSVSYGAIV